MLYCHILHKCSYLTLTLAVLLKTKYIDINYGQIFMTDAIKDKEMISTLYDCYISRVRSNCRCCRQMRRHQMIR